MLMRIAGSSSGTTDIAEPATEPPKPLLRARMLDYFERYDLRDRTDFAPCALPGRYRSILSMTSSFVSAFRAFSLFSLWNFSSMSAIKFPIDFEFGFDDVGWK